MLHATVRAKQIRTTQITPHQLCRCATQRAP
jgi:hypothetical protein